MKYKIDVVLNSFFDGVPIAVARATVEIRGEFSNGEALAKAIAAVSGSTDFSQAVATIVRMGDDSR